MTDQSSNACWDPEGVLGTEGSEVGPDPRTESNREPQAAGSAAGHRSPAFEGSFVHPLKLQGFPGLSERLDHGWRGRKAENVNIKMARSPRQGPIRTDYCEWYLNPNSDSDLDSSDSTESLGYRGDNMTPLIPLSFFSVDPLHILGTLFSGQCPSRSLFCSLLLPGFLANLSCSCGGPDT